MKIPRFTFLLLSLLTVGTLAGLQAAAVTEAVATRQLFDFRTTKGHDRYWCAAEDERGVLYFGCDGLISFDGERWQRHDTGSTYEVRSIAVGPSGRVWISAMNDLGYLDRRPTGTLGAFRSLRAQLPPGLGDLGEVWHVFVQEDRAIFATQSLVLIWDGKTFTQHRLPGVRRLVAMQDSGEVFINHRSTGLYRVSGKELKLFITAAELEGAGVSGIQKSGNGWLLITTNGLLHYENGRARFLETDASAEIRKTILYSAHKLRNGKFCVGTRAGALVLSPEGNIERWFNLADGISAPGAYGVFGSSDGALWVTLASGLARYSFDQGSTYFGEAEGLRVKPCTAIAEADQRIFAGSPGGLYTLREPNNAPPHFAPQVGAPDQNTLDLTADGDVLYAGCYRGVYRLRNETSEQILATRLDPVVLRATSRPGVLFMSDGSDLMRIDVAKPSADFIATLPESPLSIAEDQERVIWLGTRTNGVLRVQVDGRLSRFESPAITGERCLVSRVGEHLIVCSKSGVAVLTPPTGELLSVDGTPQTVPLAVSNAVGEGQVWIAFSSPFSSESDIPVLGRLTLDAGGRARWQQFAVEGLEQVGGLNALYADSHGFVWLAGERGALRVQTDAIRPVASPRAPLVSASLDPGSALPYSGNAIAFELASAEYALRPTFRFQTKLAGISENWSAPTNEPRVQLTGLRDGTYEFSARIVNDAGLTSPATTWPFRVLPPWYRTKTAYGAWTALLAAAVFGLVQWRSSYLRQQNLRLENLVRKKTAQLEQANQAKTDFIADMSHEIRNPISGIVGLSLAMEETALDVRQRQLTDSIRSCASLLATLVDDVLDFSKIEAGKIELRLAPFDVRAALEQCIAMVAEDARRAGAGLSLALDADVPPRLLGDAARIQQIILNYLTNAVKFASAGAIVVGASRVSPERIRLYVRDQGPGMSDADAAQLFTKFARLEKARANNVRGSGLGLAVCRLLAEKMDGRVGVNSKIGDGSCFWAELPLPAAADPAPATTTSAPGAPPLRALIVEDIDYNAAAMQAVLRKLGVRSDVVTDGPGALEQLQSTFYDVAFMDWNLPGMIGTEVVSRFRALESPQRRTIIIATTAYSAEFNREACLKAGMDAFIGKPLTPEKIAAALRDLRGSLRSAISVELSQQPASPTPAPSNPGQIDLHMLRFLGDNTPDGLREQIDRYLESFEKDRLTAQEAMQTGDPQAIHRIAHRLASHASMVRYEPLRELAATLQSRSATSKHEELAGLFAAFETEFELFRKKLDSLRPSAGSA